MKKTIKKLTAVVMAIASLTTCMVGMSANAYSTSGNWSVHWSKYDSNSPQNVRLVSYGNGYNAKITDKSGSCSLNYVTITALDVQVSISEKNKSVSMRPTLDGKNYVDFTVVLICGNGSEAGNFGEIVTK